MKLAILVLFVMPLLAHAIWWQLQEHPSSWATADWSSAGTLPAAASTPDAMVHVLAARTGRWKGIFAHHTWIVVKAHGASHYTRFDVVGWGAPVRVDAYPADGRWYSDAPRVLLSLRGEQAASLIPRITAAVEAYPWRSRGTYAAWPGPNSNTFVASVARAVPALAPGLLPTAIGKDYTSQAFYVGRTPSGTGVQASAGGILGFSLALVEGLEINLLGLVVGVDLRRPALKLPGWGRIGMTTG